MKEYALGFSINILLPVLGVLAYIFMCSHMRRHRIHKPPYVLFFILFATYGGILTIVLTVLFWQWSAMASIGSLYLLYPAPIVMFIGTLIVALRKPKSKFHKTAVAMGAAYIPIWIIMWISMFIFSAR